MSGRVTKGVVFLYRRESRTVDAEYGRDPVTQGRGRAVIPVLDPDHVAASDSDGFGETLLRDPRAGLCPCPTVGLAHLWVLHHSVHSDVLYDTGRPVSSRTSLDAWRVTGHDPGVNVPSNEELGQLLLHQRIRKTREGLHLTQAKFGTAVGVSERQVKRWESATSIPTPDNGQAIADLGERNPELFVIEPDEAVWLIPSSLVGELRRRLQQLEDDMSQTQDLVARGFESLRSEIRDLRRPPGDDQVTTGTGG